MLQISQGLRKGKNNSSVLSQLSEEFFNQLPSLRALLPPENTGVIDTMDLCQELEECLQLLRDMLNVRPLFSCFIYWYYAQLSFTLIWQIGEVSGRGTLGSSSDLLYRSLRGCSLRKVDDHSKDYQQLMKTLSKCPDIKVVKNIYAVNRASESEWFTKELSNQQLLFHGSKISNWVTRRTIFESFTCYDLFPFQRWEFYLVDCFSPGFLQIEQIRGCWV